MRVTFLGHLEDNFHLTSCSKEVSGIPPPIHEEFRVRRMTICLGCTLPTIHQPRSSDTNAQPRSSSLRSFGNENALSKRCVKGCHRIPVTGRRDDSWRDAFLL